MLHTNVPPGTDGTAVKVPLPPGQIVVFCIVTVGYAEIKTDLLATPIQPVWVESANEIK